MPDSVGIAAGGVRRKCANARLGRALFVMTPVTMEGASHLGFDGVGGEGSAAAKE